MPRILFMLLALAWIAGCTTVTPTPSNLAESLEFDSMLIPDHAQRTRSGYVYAYLRHGTNEMPAVTDAVRVHVTVRNLEGSILDDQEATISVSHSTPFLEEILPILDVGSAVRVWGESPSRIWDIALVGIDLEYRAPEDVAGPPDDAQVLPGFDGVWWKVLDPGHGPTAKTGQNLRIQATRWDRDGAVLESNRATEGMAVQLVPGSRQLDPIHFVVLHELREGAHARLWMQAETAGTPTDIVEDLWVARYLPELDAPSDLAVPLGDAGLVEVAKDAAWMRFITQNPAPKLAENDAVEVAMTCWNAASGELVVARTQDSHDVMEISPNLGIWYDVMTHAAPGDSFMVWIRATALPAEVNMDLTCRVRIFQG